MRRGLIPTRQFATKSWISSHVGLARNNNLLLICTIRAPISQPKMADTSFADGDLYIGLGEPSAPSSAGPSTPSGSVRDGRAGKKRKAESTSSADKRQKHQPPPQPRAEKNYQLKIANKAKEKKERKAATKAQKKERSSTRGAPWADDVDWDECRDPAEMCACKLYSQG